MQTIQHQKHLLAKIGKLSKHCYINFTNFWMDEEHAFNLSTGIFTAPLDGFYEFSFVSYLKENIKSQITVEKNGHVEFSSYRKKIIHNDTDGLNWIMNLKMGDRIRLKIDNFYDGSFRIFNGKLIVRL